MLKNFKQPQVALEDDEDLCLAQSYEFESILSNKSKSDDEDIFFNKRIPQIPHLALQSSPQMKYPGTEMAKGRRASPLKASNTFKRPA